MISKLSVSNPRNRRVWYCIIRIFGVGGWAKYKYGMYEQRQGLVTSLMISRQFVALLCSGEDSCTEEPIEATYLFVFLRLTRTALLSIYYCTVVITMAMVMVRVVQSGTGTLTSPVFWFA